MKEEEEEVFADVKMLEVKHPVERKWPTRVAALFVLCLIAITTYVVVDAVFLKEAGVEKEDVVFMPDLEELTDPRAFKKAFLQANGGLDYLGELQTLRIEGRMENGDAAFDFFVLKRRPDMMLMTYTLGRADFTIGSKGEDFWMRKSLPKQPDVVSDVPEDQKRGLAPSIPMFGPILSAYLDEAGRVESIVVDEWEGETCLRVEISKGSDSGEEKIAFYVDPVSMQPMVQFNPKAGPDAFLTEYQDHRKVGKVSIAHKVITKRNGEETGRIVVESARFNVGVSSAVFDRDS